MLGDSHNFGRRVELRGENGARTVHKPRTVFWEWLLLSAASPLRRALDEAAQLEEPEAFRFLPDLAFDGWRSREGGSVEHVALAPLGALTVEGRRSLARVVGRALALFSWLGLADLHWENLALGAHDERIVLAPLDVEMILADLSLPTETKLLPDADPEYAALSRHACGVRRALPFLGKPVAAADLVAVASTYDRTLALLDRHARTIADTLASLPELREAPIRVILRATADYVAPPRSLWPPLIEAEREQLARGDIPYFFRLYGQPGIRYYADPSLETVKMLPLAGDVPKLDPLLRVSRGLRSSARQSLREQGLFAVLAAFDHPSFTGTHAADELEVTFRARSLVVKLPDGDTLDARRDLRGFVGSVYLPCTCGEVRDVLVPKVTRCESVRASTRRGSSRRRAREL